MTDHEIPFPEIVHRYVLKEERDKVKNQRIPRKPLKIAPRNYLTYDYPHVAKPVTFPSSFYKNVSLSPIYSHTLGLSYMQQCFNNVSFIGEGSYGIVFRGLSKDDGKYYAIKKFKDRFRSGAHRKARLSEVYRYGSIPQSQFCVELIRAWEESGHLFIQMELCSVTLDQYVTQNKIIEEEKFWNILLDLLLGIKHLHSHEFIHLDIKPDNILVSSNHIFKLGDFGLMLDVSKGPVTDAEEGDSRYLAPEVLNGVFTKAADIFSIGISMLEVASNICLPSSGPLWHELRCGILPWQHFTCSSKEFYNVLRMMMLPSYQERPPVDLILKHPKLRRLQRSRYIQAIFGEMAATMKTWYNYGKTAAVNYGLGVLKPFHNLYREISWKDLPVAKFSKNITGSRRSSNGILKPAISASAYFSIYSQQTSNQNGSISSTLCHCPSYKKSLSVPCKKRILLDDVFPSDLDSEAKKQLSTKKRKLFT